MMTMMTMMTATTMTMTDDRRRTTDDGQHMTDNEHERGRVKTDGRWTADGEDDEDDEDGERRMTDDGRRMRKAFVFWGGPGATAAAGLSICQYCLKKYSGAPVHQRPPPSKARRASHGGPVWARLQSLADWHNDSASAWPRRNLSAMCVPRSRLRAAFGLSWLSRSHAVSNPRGRLVTTAFRRQRG